MLNIIEKFEENVKQYTNSSILYDEATPRGVNYLQMEKRTGQVYAYLKSKGVGKEDFVLINLPRGIQPVLAIFGIWKAGAAFALVEDTYAPERIEYIRKDCNCKVEINSDVWDDILQLEPLDGYEKVDDHDAAYAIYTSGTTGNPKGVLHEFGNVMECINSVKVNDGEDLIKKGAIGALLAPLNFVASIMFIAYAMYFGGVKVHIVSYTTLKNPMLLMKLFLEKRISITFLTPSYVRMLSGKTGPFLKTIIVGSEPANNLYIKGVTLYNFYAQSETGFAAGVFEIDKSYGTCPIGRPQFDLEYKIVNENHEEVAVGETGELVLRNEFVRGYLNLPEETAQAFVDGFYYTGDLARMDENGNMTLLGRSNDMIKINGNRIEPAEIEAAVKNVLGISWAAAKGFEDEGQSFLCAYYKDDVEVDSEKVREALLKRLPYYMIPAYFIKIDEIPLKPNGKMDRAALPKPDTSDFQSEYVAPTNEIEEKICDAFAVVLKLGRVGINDDFYEMGGDSLGAIELIETCDLPGLTASEIFRGRTPENIAKLYEKVLAEDDGVPPEVKNDEAMKVSHQLTAEQKYMYDYQLNTPKSTMYNLYTVLKVDKDEFDMKQMAKAMEKTIRNHPALLTTYFIDDDLNVAQHYTPEVLRTIHVEYMTDWEFNNNIKDNLVQPFRMSHPTVPNKLFRCRLFETESCGYIFFDVHHSIFDGTSFKVFMENIGKAYLGLELEKDYYYLELKRREDAIHSEFYKESKDYFENTYEGIEWQTFPKVNKKGDSGSDLGEILCDMDVLNTDLEYLEKSNKISRNEFFISAALLSISIYNNYPNISINWIYNGRENMELMSSVGLLFRELPVAVKFDDNMTIRNLYSSVHVQVQRGIEHSCYPYIDTKTGGTEFESAYLLYQQDIRDGGNSGMEMETVDVRQNQAATQTMLDIEILDGSEGLQVMIDYAMGAYDDDKMEGFKDLFLKVVHTLISNNSQDDVTIKEFKNMVKEKNLLKKFVGILRHKKF
ncbi:MAG: AMP-binding protein [Lachnospiraceae bacterium]|nr:AMP-binding protein [Lachnospiraceae bacterium]